MPPIVATEKDKELFVYVADRLKDEPSYGATLLNKALFFIDNISYLSYKKPISTFTYVKQEFGPTPEPKKFLLVRDSLLKNGDIQEIQSDFFGKVQRKYIPKRTAKSELFTNDEIILIDKVVAQIALHNATSISNLTHDFMSWKFANTFEEIPFSTFLLSSKLPSEEDIKWAKEKIANHISA